MLSEHYERFARIIALTYDRQTLVDSLISYFKEDNPRFDPSKFDKRIKSIMMGDDLVEKKKR